MIENALNLYEDNFVKEIRNQNSFPKKFLLLFKTSIDRINHQACNAAHNPINSKKSKSTKEIIGL